MAAPPLQSLGSLSPQILRTTYLRGIDLGPAWQGPGADAALAQLMDFQLAQAEQQMNIQFRPWRVLTLPDSSLTPGMDYDIEGALIPFVPLMQDETVYQVPLGYHDVQTLTQVRLYEGLDTGSPPAPILTPVDLATVAYDRLAERVQVPEASVFFPDTALAWAIDYTMGLGRIPPEVAQWVMLSTAIQTLAMAGAGEAVSHGLEREELHQDGVVERVAYAGMSGHGIASGGPYGGAINLLKRQLEEIDLPKLRFRYQGSHFQVLPGAGLRTLTDPRI